MHSRYVLRKIRMLNCCSRFCFNFSFQFIKNILGDLRFVRPGFKISNELIYFILQLSDIGDIPAWLGLKLHIIGHWFVVLIIYKDTVLNLLLFFGLFLLEVDLLGPLPCNCFLLLGVLGQVNPVNDHFRTFVISSHWSCLDSMVGFRMLILLLYFSLLHLVFMQYVLEFGFNILFFLEKARSVSSIWIYWLSHIGRQWIEFRR